MRGAFQASVLAAQLFGALSGFKALCLLQDRGRNACGLHTFSRQQRQHARWVNRALLFKI